MATQYTAGLTTGQVLTAATMNSIGAVSESFTPTWSSTGTQPVLGNGTLVARYFRIQKMIFVEMHLRMGSTTTYGTGSYRFSLPFTARTPIDNYMQTGTLFLFDASTGGLYYGLTAFSAGSTTVVRGYVGATDPGEIGQTTPFTFAVNDQISMKYSYEAA